MIIDRPCEYQEIEIKMLKVCLAHPLTRGLYINSPHTSHLRRRIIQEKGFLKKIYQEWFLEIASSLPDGEGPILEIGSGAGFMDEFIPGLIASDVFKCPGIQAVLDGSSLPFIPGSLRGIVMTNVLHHLPLSRKFFAEAARCVRPGGVISMIEPWCTPFSRLVYSKIHHEPFDPEMPEWEFPFDGPLSGANSASPWIIFQRDRRQFKQEFPEWRIQKIRPFMPFRYLLSGGVSLRSLMPGILFGVWRWLEEFLDPQAWGMFAYFVLTRVKADGVHDVKTG